MSSYRSVAAVIGPSIQAGIAQVWPPRPGMMPGEPISLSTLCDRYASAGEALDAFAQESGPGVWKYLTREAVVETLRERLVDPAVIDQTNAGLCGPMSILVELARRDPLQYVVAAQEMFDHGKYHTPSGKVIVAEEELREEEPPGKMAAADWLLGGSFRNDENLWEDVDSGDTEFNGLETLTTPWEMAEWIREVLGLDSDVESCLSFGEVDVLRECEEAVQQGGVAFLCVDDAVIQYGESDTEEDVWFTRRSHRPGGLVIDDPVHCRDNGIMPTHWILHLGGMQLNGDKLLLPVWSWASEFTVTGSAEDFGEYLYYGVIGRPH